jgi:radical SAM superfamily enzyme YgiQ (UPF0313 family)
MIGFPEDTRQSIRAVLRYAKQVDPYVANFNVCTPYPGTDWLSEIEHLIDNRDWSRYDVYTPNLKYEHLSAEDVHELHQECFRQYYFRWKYLKENGQFLFPRLHGALGAARRLVGREPAAPLQEASTATMRLPSSTATGEIRSTLPILPQAESARKCA